MAWWGVDRKENEMNTTTTHMNTIEEAINPAPGQQIGCVVHQPGSGNPNWIAACTADEEAKGNVVVHHDGFSAIHAPAPVKQSKE